MFSDMALPQGLVLTLALARLTCDNDVANDLHPQGSSRVVLKGSGAEMRQTHGLVDKARGADRRVHQTACHSQP